MASGQATYQCPVSFPVQYQLFYNQAIEYFAIYGAHDVEMRYAIMGKDCLTVTRVARSDTDFVFGAGRNPEFLKTNVLSHAINDPTDQ